MKIFEWKINQRSQARRNISRQFAKTRVLEKISQLRGYPTAEKSDSPTYRAEKFGSKVSSPKFINSREKVSKAAYEFAEGYRGIFRSAPRLGNKSDLPPR